MYRDKPNDKWQTVLQNPMITSTKYSVGIFRIGLRVAEVTERANARDVLGRRGRWEGTRRSEASEP